MDKNISTNHLRKLNATRHKIKLFSSFFCCRFKVSKLYNINTVTPAKAGAQANLKPEYRPTKLHFTCEPSMAPRFMLKCLLKLSALLLLVCFTSCGSPSSSTTESTPSSLITITDSFLKANTSHLSGTLAVYPEDSATPLTAVDLLFAEDGNGDVTVTSPSIKLKKSTVYRFVVIFYWDGLAYAYVDTTQTVGNESTDQITFSESLIVYSTSSNPDVSASISGGVLPNLDSDGDGYSNFEELRAGTNPNDGNSVPDGPAIIWENPVQGRTVSGVVEINVSASDQNGVATLEILNPPNLTDKAFFIPDLVLADWDTTSRSDGEIILKVRASDTKGNISESTIIVNISNKLDLNGPEVGMDVYKLKNGLLDEPIDYINGETVKDSIRIFAKAIDPHNPSSLNLKESSFSGAIKNIITSPVLVNGYQADIDITSFDDGALLSFDFTGQDSLQNISTKSFILRVKNKPYINLLTLDNHNLLQETIHTYPTKDANSLNIAWNISEGEEVRIYKGDACLKELQYVWHSNNTEGSENINVGSYLVSGDYIFCAIHKAINFSGDPTESMSPSQIFNLFVDNDSDGFANEEDCAPNESKAYPGNTTATLMDSDYNCDGDDRDINLADAPISFIGSAAGDKLGYSVQYAGDVNNDGCSDILLSAKDKIYLIYGHGEKCFYKTPLNKLNDLSQIGSDALPGTLLLTERSGDYTGYSLAGAGDINNDYCDDFLIGGGPSYTNGKVYVVYGRGLGCDITTAFPGYSTLGQLAGTIIISGSSLNAFGASLAGLGDANGDSRLDIGIGEPGLRTSITSNPPISTLNQGGALQIYSSKTTFGQFNKSTIKNEFKTGRLGTSVATMGHFNADGYDDIIVGTGCALDGYPDSCVIGQPEFNFIAGEANFSFDTKFYSKYGYTMNYTPFNTKSAYTGDVQGDGKSSIILANDLWGNTTIAFSNGSSIVPISYINFDLEMDTTSISGGSNINRDAFDASDFIVGGSDGVNNGAAYIVMGSQNINSNSILNSRFKLISEKGPIGAVSIYGGMSLDGPISGDFNGDKCADPIIGAPNYGENNQGKVYIMLSGYCPVE